MKCKHCGGLIIHDPGCFPDGPTHKCMSCGRRPGFHPRGASAPEGEASGPEGKEVMDEMNGKEGAMITGEKICSKCKKPFPKDTEHFSRNANRKDGLENECKICKNKYSKNYRLGTRVRSELKKAAPNPKPKRKIAHRDPAPAPVLSASPAEIVVALRKGMAAEIVALIQERYGL